MSTEASTVEILLEKTGEYTKTTVELYRLKAIDKSADLASGLGSGLVILLFVAFVFLAFNIGMALWLGEMMGKYYYGFFVVSGFYAIVGIVLYIFRDKWLKTPIRDSIVTQVLK